MYELPTLIELNGESFKIRNDGDFRVILRLFQVFNDESMEKSDKTIASLMIFYEDLNTVEDVFYFPYKEEAVDAMFNFINCNQESNERPTTVKLVDWEKDSVLISSAINNVAGKEIRAEKYLHWWTFVGYYMAIGECALAQVINIRQKLAKGKKLEKYELTFKQENPQYFDMDFRTNEQREDDEYFANLWKGGKG